jgi:hypothetical protein
MKCNRIAAFCAFLSLGICGLCPSHSQTPERASKGNSTTISAFEEEPAVPSRIVRTIDDTKLVQLPGNTHPMARTEFDKGLVDPQLLMERMLLLLTRSPEQETALEAFMAEQLDPKSPNFHHWLEPAEFGKLYGPSDADIAAVTNWLQNHGFTVDKVTNGRVFIEFSGIAAHVQQAFHTEIHRYSVNGEEHIANNSDPAIPEALSPVVAGVVSLHNFFSKPLHRDLGPFRRDTKTGKWAPQDESVISKPLFNPPPADAGFELVSPYDFATIYNVLPLWTAGIDGTGQTIAIAGRSDINLTDVANFRSAFGLPVNAPTIITNGPDPGIPTASDKVENTLDVEWSGAVAKGATIKFVTTASTMTTDGASESALYIVDNNVAPIMSFSYGNCELAAGTAGNAAANSLWQQGAAAGITVFVASGDQGSAACDGGQTAPYSAAFGLAVSGTSSTPYDVAVGGTDLNWANNTGTNYWSATNATNGLSVLGYIPEVPWNGTCVSDDIDKLIGATALMLDEEQTCQYLLTNNVDTFLVNATGGTGGVSACTTPSSTTVASCSGGYAKPSWQTGTGVPADGKRDVPDVSLFASGGSLNSAYIICDSDTAPCTYSDATDALAQGVGGTSVASPAMAGIMALVLQQVGGTAQGLPNAEFYSLAAKDNLTACNSNTVAGGNSCIFYDITSDNNAVPCAPGSPNCTVIHVGDTVGVLGGYTSTTGYDLATGLGSVNAYNLVHAWPIAAAAPPFGNLDRAADSTTSSTTIPQTDSLLVRGWVADVTDGAPLSNVKVYIDGVLIGTPTLGIARPDVAAAYHNTAYTNSGYQLLYSAASLALGSHAVTVVAIDSGSRSTTFGPLSITITTSGTPPFGNLDQAVDSTTSSSTIPQTDSLLVRGWVADVTDGAPLSNVKVYIDGALIGTPTLGIARPDVAAAYHNAAYTNSGYRLLFPAASLTLGTHSVTVVAIDSGSRSTTFGPLSITVQ